MRGPSLTPDMPPGYPAVVTETSAQISDRCGLFGMPPSSHHSNFRPVRALRQLRRRSEIEFRTDADFL